MKKITLLFIFSMAIATMSYGQCTTNTGGQYPASAVTLGNTGGVETIATDNWPNAEFTVIENVQSGSDYTIAATPSLYITVTNTADDSVIVHGAGSVSFTAAAGLTSITVFWHLDAACGTQASGNTTTTIQCTTCTCDFTVAPSCVTEISPADNEMGAVTGPGGSVSFTWNEDPNATSYELFINGFSQGQRSSGITLTGLGYDASFTWSVVPSNCFGEATGCPEWSFTTEACAEISAPTAAAPTAPYPTDAATAVPVQAPDGGLAFSWSDTAGPGEWYNLNIGTTNPPTQTLVGVEIGEVITGLSVSTTYFWSIDVANCFGTTTGATVWSFTTDATLGIEENLLYNSFSVYPNPTSNILNIQGSNDIDNVTVFNLLGQNVVNFSKNEITNSSVNLSELSKGLYLVKISSGDKTQTLRVTKK